MGAASPAVGVSAGAGVNAPTAYLLVENGKPTHEVVPWGPKWPMRRGIREIIIIAGRRVADRECKTRNIPLTHNVNFPHMYGPLGQGTPKDLELLNLAVDSIISDLVWHVRKSAFPTGLVSDSLARANPDIPKELYNRPGTMLTIPDNVLAQIKDYYAAMAPPPASPDIWRLLGQLLDLMDKQGNMADVLQGDTTAGMSGKLFADASNAAASVVMFQTKRAETMLKYLADLMLDGLQQMSIESMHQSSPDIPIYVWDAFKEWWKRGLNLDITVEISSGGGQAKQQKTAQLLQAKQMGAQVADPYILESMNLDPDDQASRQRAWVAENQPMIPQGGPVQAGPPQAAAAPSPPSP